MITTHAEASTALLALSRQLSRACNDAGAFLGLVEAADLSPPREINLHHGYVMLQWKDRAHLITLAFGPVLSFDGAETLEWLKQELKR